MSVTLDPTPFFSSKLMTFNSLVVKVKLVLKLLISASFPLL